MNDSGVSELLGYAIIIGMVAIAVICVTTGAAGAIYSSAERIGYSEAKASISSFAAIAVETARANNTCYVAYELQLPPGYELLAMDMRDDIARIGVKLGEEEMPAIRVGSLRLQSPFRSVSFEGGAVVSNDSGIVDMVRKPSIFFASHDGRKELYVCLVGITADTGSITPGPHAVLQIRVASQRTESRSVPVPSDAVISISTRDPEGWATLLENAGFTVTIGGNTVVASAGGVTDIHVTSATVQVRPGS
ncbi:MAG: hypothetical protein A4E28_01455 [Methanocella sp. PtaU1.Bin125]|nr:MAG: hypothetical protein A4E28_01455 [Methanocella sp. PtaU1.Bin125]